MNGQLFKTLLELHFATQMGGGSDDRGTQAKALANAYHLANVGQTTTPFGAPLINADKQPIETFAKLSFDINFYGAKVKSTALSILAVINNILKSLREGSKIDVSFITSILNSEIDGLFRSLPKLLQFLKPIIKGLVDSLINTVISDLLNAIPGQDTFKKAISNITKIANKVKGIIESIDVQGIAATVMATGFCLYWLTAKFSPMPPMPPCIAPTSGVTVILPGFPIPLNSDIKNMATKNNTTSSAISQYYNALIKHQLTVVGFYLGSVPTPIGIVPAPPIPWVSLLSIPLPEIKLPKILDTNLDGIKDKASGALSGVRDRARTASSGGKSGSSSGGVVRPLGSTSTGTPPPPPSPPPVSPPSPPSPPPAQPGPTGGVNPANIPGSTRDTQVLSAFNNIAGGVFGG